MMMGDAARVHVCVMGVYVGAGVNMRTGIYIIYKIAYENTD